MSSSQSTPQTLQAILYTPAKGSSQPPTLQVLDQLSLPHRSTYLPLRTAEDAFAAIKNMSVRGAPAIAIVAALAVAVEVSAQDQSGGTAADVQDLVVDKLQYLLRSGPTAVNLNDAVQKLSVVVQRAAGLDGASAESVRMGYVTAAEKMLVDDVGDNKAIGENGAEWMRAKLMGHGREKVAVLTHCNTGSLATAGYGTALGIVRSLHSKSLLSRAYYTETLPYNQGSRLTGYELLHDEIPSTLITDSMAAALFQKSLSEQDPIAAVIVGADRVAANGDTANKIGTYALAVLARFHSVKFLVAAPRTTIDLATESGRGIVIEQRPPEEMLSVRGPKNLGFDTQTGIQNVDVGDIESVSIAALGTNCWNPAFDVTPAELIDGIVTEVGVVEKDSEGRFRLDMLFEKQEIQQELNEGVKPLPDPVEGP